MKQILFNDKNNLVLTKIIEKNGLFELYEGYKYNNSESNLYLIKIFELQNKDYYYNEISTLEELNNEIFIKYHFFGQGNISLYKKEEEKDNKKEDLISHKKVVNFIVFDYSSGWGLFDYIKASNGFSEKLSANIFAKIVKGINLMHINNIAFGNLKPENILISKEFYPKLFGFHLSREISINNSSEDKKERNKAIKEDIVSLGVLLLTMKIGNCPFNFELQINSSNSFKKKESFVIFQKICKNYDLPNRKLIEKLIFQNQKILSANEILKEPWIKEYVNESISNNNERMKQECINELEGIKNKTVNEN